MSQNESWKVVPRSYCSAAAEQAQREEIGELPEHCLLQLVLSLTAPQLHAWCPQELKQKHTLSPYAQMLGIPQRAPTGAVKRIPLG